MDDLIYDKTNRAQKLALRIKEGADALLTFANDLSNSEWETPVEGDGRTVGVVVHHVASVYPLEIELAQKLVKGEPITEATMEVVDKMNADHAKEFANISKKDALELLKINSFMASESVKTLTNEELDNSAAVSLNSNAPLTAQFFIEDHALRHSFHHLAKIKSTLEY